MTSQVMNKVYAHDFMRLHAAREDLEKAIAAYRSSQATEELDAMCRAVDYLIDVVDDETPLVRTNQEIADES